MTRCVIIGNSGSGKTWLGRALGGAIALDDLHWMPGGHDVARDPDVARALVRDAAAGQAWVIEGVFGWLAEPALARATLLVWLDVPVADCLAGLAQRGATDAALLAWAAAYPTRQTSSSHAGHGRLFDGFAGSRLRLRSRQEIAAWLAC